MPMPTAKKKKEKKNLTDVNLVARSVVETAIGEPLIITSLAFIQRYGLHQQCKQKSPIMYGHWTKSFVY
jgi:hypothetical protein